MSNEYTTSAKPVKRERGKNALITIAAMGILGGLVYGSSKLFNYNKALDYSSPANVAERAEQAKLEEKANFIIPSRLGQEIIYSNPEGRSILVKNYDWQLEFWTDNIGLCSESLEPSKLEKVQIKSVGEVITKNDGKIRIDKWDSFERDFRGYIEQVYEAKRSTLENIRNN